MPSFGADDDDGDVLGSANGSSDNEQDENMDELEDNDGDVGAEGDQDAEGDEDDNDDDDDQDDGPRQATGSQSNSGREGPDSLRDNEKAPDASHGAGTNGISTSGSTLHTNPQVLLTSPSPANQAASPVSNMIMKQTIRPEALTANVYDIVPTIAAPHSTSINAVTATPDLRWVFSGGADGYIRKFNWIDTVNSKVMLTVAQRHPFVDSVTKAGVLMSYWENEEPIVKSPIFQSNDDNLSLSPVYSLAVQSEALWLLSGLESGGINLQSVRHDEGKRIACLRQHTSAVSVLSLAPDEKSFLSGSWDKNVLDWDLETGKVRRTFEGSGGQISAIEARPLSTLPVPEEAASLPLTNGTLTSNNDDPPAKNDVLTNGVGSLVAKSEKEEAEPNELVPGSPMESLFGGNDVDSLFGDNEDGTGVDGTSTGNAFGEDDNEISKAINSEMHHQNDDSTEDTTMLMGDAPEPSLENTETQDTTESQPAAAEMAKESTGAESKASPEKSDIATERTVVNESKSPREQAPPSGPAMVSESTFLATSIDGTLRVWDRRKPNPVATILPRNAPPWCMNACWSPDGNFLYAGRRNGTVEEYSLHKGLRDSERTFKFPQGSGPVSAVRAMPNGKHLICASFDILRLYDLKEPAAIKHSTVPFLIIPGHRGGVISSLYTDPTCSYLISTAGSRGWEGSTTEVLLGYEIGVL